jgi:hypothetical protein
MTCNKVGEMEETNTISSPTFVTSMFCIPTLIPISPILQAICPITTIIALCRIQWGGDEKLCGILHETIEEGKGPKLALGSLKSSPPIDTKDTKVSPLHTTFNLKGVLVKKDHFRINHLLPLLFNLHYYKSGVQLISLNQYGTLKVE